MSDQKKNIRALREVANLFFSTSLPSLGQHKNSSTPTQSEQGPHPADILHARGAHLVSSLFLSGHETTKDSSTNNEGIILLNQEKFVVFINRKAQDLLDLKGQKLLGQLFNYFIRPDEPIQIGILRPDKTTGLGEMVMTRNESRRNHPYTVKIRDISFGAHPARQ